MRRPYSGGPTEGAAELPVEIAHPLRIATVRALVEQTKAGDVASNERCGDVSLPPGSTTLLRSRVRALTSLHPAHSSIGGHGHSKACCWWRTHQKSSQLGHGIQVPEE